MKTLIIRMRFVGYTGIAFIRSNGKEKQYFNFTAASRHRVMNAMYRLAK